MKKNLRKKMLKQQANLPKEYRQTAENSIANLLFSLQAYQEAKMIFCYVGTSLEINTSRWIEKCLQDGKRVCVPKTIRLGLMEAREITSLADLEMGNYHILEPNSVCPIVEKRQIDLAIIPCVTVDKFGFRLGYGGGFYDQYLQDTEFLTILCIWAMQVVDEVPHEAHDIAIDWLITEQGVEKIGEEK